MVSTRHLQVYDIHESAFRNAQGCTCVYVRVCVHIIAYTPRRYVLLYKSLRNGIFFYSVKPHIRFYVRVLNAQYFFHPELCVLSSLYSTNIIYTYPNLFHVPW